MRLTFVASVLALAFVLEQSSLISANLNTTSIAKSLEKLDECFQDTVLSFVVPTNYVPLNASQLSDMCKKNTNGLQCIREKSQNDDPLLKRFLRSYIQARQKFLKKYCNNINSETSKSLLRAINCVWNNKRSAYVKTDNDYVAMMQAIEKKRFSDSKLELKYICCSILKYADNYEKDTRPECSEHQRIWKEIVQSFTSHELGLLCTDDDKFLEVTCPSLPTLDTLTKPDLSKISGLLTIYLVMTLGEP